MNTNEILVQLASFIFYNCDSTKSRQIWREVFGYNFHILYFSYFPNEFVSTKANQIKFIMEKLRATY